MRSEPYSEPLSKKAERRSADSLRGCRYVSLITPTTRVYSSAYQRNTRSARNVFQRLALPTSVSICKGMNSG